MLTRTRAAAFATLFAVTAPAAHHAAAAEAMEETSMALPALTIGFAANYIADALGFWEKRNLKVAMRDITGIGSMNAMLAGSVDFSNSSGPTVIRANIRGQKVLGIGSTLDGLPFEIVVRNDVLKAAGVSEKSPLDKRVQALKGKKVSLTSVNTIPHAYLRYFARKGGLNPERDMTVVAMPPEAGIAALKSGTVDAYVQAPPWTMIAVRQANAARLSSPIRGDLPELVPFAFNIVVTRPDVCEKRPSVCQKLMDGYGDGLRYMHQHPRESLAVLSKKMPKVDPAVLAEAFDLTVRWTPKSTRMNLKGLANSQELMLAGGMIKAGEQLKSFDGIITNKYTK